MTQLQKFIISAMVKWSNEEIFDPNLISQIFSLLYRQFDEINEVTIYTLYLKLLPTCILIN